MPESKLERKRRPKGIPQIKTWLGCRLGHQWRSFQHNVRVDENDRDVFVIAWKQCERCAKSKLIHLLE